MFDWRWKNVMQKRLVSMACDIDTLYKRFSYQEGFIRQDIIPLIAKLDGRIAQLEKENTELRNKLLKEKGRVLLTIYNKE